jgi:AcrR family transcriptional regulator
MDVGETTRRHAKGALRARENDTGGMATNERLLRAAGEVFAQRGFRAATVREISQHAKANVAAVNYHFKDKKALYIAVLRYAVTSAYDRYPPDYGLGDNPTAEDRLHAFIRSMLFRLLDKGRPAWHGKLMIRELADPTPGLDELIESSVRPMNQLLSSIVREIMGEAAEDESVALCAMSIIGQCLFYRHGRPILSTMYPGRYGPNEVDLLAEHIKRFSICGIKEFSKEGCGTIKPAEARSMC